MYGDRGVELFRMVDEQRNCVDDVFGSGREQRALCFRLGKILRMVEADGQHAGVGVRTDNGTANNRHVHFYFFVGPANDRSRFGGRCWMCIYRGINWLNGNIECHIDPPTRHGYPLVGGDGAPAGSPPFCSRFAKGNGVRFSKSDIDEATNTAETESRMAKTIRESTSMEDEEKNILQLGRTLAEEQKTEKDI